MIPCCKAVCSPISTRSFHVWVRSIFTRSRSTPPSARSETSNATDTCKCRNRQAALRMSPNTLSENSPRETPAKGFHSAAVTETGEKGRIRAESFADHYSQARQFYLSQTSYEQAHIASALVFELSKVEHVRIRK